MPSTLADGKVLLDAFPFDSNPDLITDVNGYLMGDRSVDAWTMRSAFKQFFSNGVFGTPANAWQIAKGAEGLTVTVQPGMAVIEGAMGGIEDRTGQLTITLDNQPGRAADAVRVLSQAGIGISYLYSFLLGGKGILVFRTDDAERTNEVILRERLASLDDEALVALV